jgi:hypothetical protein
MQALIDEFDPSTTVEGIKELKGLVEAGGLLVAAALPAAAEQQKAAAQPKPMMAVAEPKQPMAKAPASAAKPVMGAKAKAKQAALPPRRSGKAGTAAGAPLPLQKPDRRRNRRPLRKSRPEKTVCGRRCKASCKKAGHEKTCDESSRQACTGSEEAGSESQGRASRADVLKPAQ